jgi:hypothetical protein
MMDRVLPLSAGSDQFRAKLRLLALAAVLIAGLAASREAGVPAGRVSPPGQGDVALHSAVIERLANGESYYDATGTELRGRGYPTLSVFNWRPPLLFVAMAQGLALARVALIGLCVLVLLATIPHLMRQTLPIVAAGVLALVGALAFGVVPRAVVFHEAWTGVLVALSVCLYMRERWNVAALVGVLALFVRELAAPYCVVAGLQAVYGRRWREVGIWTSGACLYAVYFANHFLQVRAHLLPGDMAHAVSWVQWGGLPFFLSALRCSNAMLLVLPAWAAAVALMVIAAGLMDRTVNVHLRLAAASYLVFLAVVGHSFNVYWGLVPGIVFASLFWLGLKSLGSVVVAAAPMRIVNRFPSSSALVFASGDEDGARARVPRS